MSSDVRAHAGNAFPAETTAISISDDRDLVEHEVEIAGAAILPDGWLGHDGNVTKDARGVKSLPDERLPEPGPRDAGVQRNSSRAGRACVSLTPRRRSSNREEMRAGSRREESAKIRPAPCRAAAHIAQSTAAKRSIRQKPARAKSMDEERDDGAHGAEDRAAPSSVKRDRKSRAQGSVGHFFGEENLKSRGEGEDAGEQEKGRMRLRAKEAPVSRLVARSWCSSCSAMGVNVCAAPAGRESRGGRIVEGVFTGKYTRRRSWWISRHRRGEGDVGRGCPLSNGKGCGQGVRNFTTTAAPVRIASGVSAFTSSQNRNDAVSFTSRVR